MKVKPLVVTTSSNSWMAEEYDRIKEVVLTAEGAEIEDFTTIHIDSPETVGTFIDQDGDIKISLDWFKENLTTKYPEYNTICFHYSRDDREKWGLTESLNGFYWYDANDSYHEFVVCADDGQNTSRRQKRKMSQFLRVFLHELGHGFARWTGMDLKLVHHYDYDLKDIEAFYAQVSFKRWNLMKALMIALTQLVGLLKKQLQNKSRIEDWAKAIQLFEGWYEGSRSWRHNNPGNLRWSPFEEDNIDNFSWFSTYEKGFEALKYQLTIAADGRSKVYNPEMTLKRFFEVYAPSNDGNYPEHYARFVADKLQVDVNVKIKHLL